MWHSIIKDVEQLDQNRGAVAHWQCGDDVPRRRHLPVAAAFGNEDVRQWVWRAEADDITYDQLRDATLMDFDTEADVLMFTWLMHGMNISFRGMQYIDNNAYV